MDPLRIIHFADLHLGVEAGGRPNPASGLNQRIHDVLDRLDEVCACAERDGVHAVVFAGDAFKHQHPTPTLQSLFAERIRRLARAGCGVFLLVGNHDLPKMTSLAHPFSIYDALEVEGVVVGDRAAVYRLPLPTGAPAPEMQVAALPHFSRAAVLARLPEGTTPEAADELIGREVERTVTRLSAEADPVLPAVFAGHCHVNQAQLSTAQNLFGVSELEVTLSSLVGGRAFPYYALGHVHRPQVLSREPFVAYPGSLERMDFGEGETVRVAADGRLRRTGGEHKGFYRADLVAAHGAWRLSGAPEFRTVDARPFVTVKVEVALGAEDPNGAVLRALDRARRGAVGFDRAFVKVQVTLDALDRPRLRHGAVREAVPEAYDVRVGVQTREEAAAVRDPRFAVRMREAEALDRYLETREDWAQDREELARLGRALIDEALS